MNGRELRPYQRDAIDHIRQSVRSGVRRMVLQLPTGGGKTLIAAQLASAAMAKGKRLAFVVPALALIDQTVEEFADAGVREVGVVQAEHQMTDWAKPVQVCSVQTLQRRKDYPDVGAVIFDEVHRMYQIQKMWLRDEAWQEVPFIGLSATPWTRGLGRFFQSLLVAATTQQLIDQGYLAPFRVFASGHPDLTGVRTVAGDYHEDDLSNVMQGGNLTADIIRTWQEKGTKDRTLVFAVDRAHAQSLQERFVFAGVTAGYQDALTPPNERAEIKRKFHSGEMSVVVNIQTMTTGVDWDVRTLVLARPTKSEILFTQIIGRALRVADGKEHAIILDHSDTTQRLGFVTDIHHDELDDGKPHVNSNRPKVDKPLPIFCRMCDFVMPRGTRKCLYCGYEMRTLSSIMERDGVLVEISRDGSMFKAAKVAAHLWTREEKELFLSELKGYAKQHGYKPGWAQIKYREKFKEWPDDMMRFIPAAAIISPTVALWVRSRNIAWAKSRRRQEEGQRG
jgi:superfamily II DNA or RNA helicase